MIKLVCAFDALLVAAAGIVGLACGRTVQLIDPYDPVQREITGKMGTSVGEPVDVFVWGRSRLIDAPAGQPHPYYDRSKGYPIQMRTYWIVYAIAAAAMLGGSLTVLAISRAVSRRKPESRSSLTS